ncbi:MAG: hypothetical protein EOP38_14270 [Rubrivivax sp.]|nr:MAG: hypothetical protein EOP38_14270 [Rubrivivax sp.]
MSSVSTRQPMGWALIGSLLALLSFKDAQAWLVDPSGAFPLLLNATSGAVVGTLCLGLAWAFRPTNASLPNHIKATCIVVALGCVLCIATNAVLALRLASASSLVGVALAATGLAMALSHLRATRSSTLSPTSGQPRKPS